MSNYTDYIPVPKAAVVDIMEAYGDSTISGSGDIYMGSFYGEGSGLTGVSTISAHSDLTNLDEDDHEQYLLADGSRDVSGDLMPEMTGASGINSVRDIGSTTEKFQNLYIGTVTADGSSADNPAYTFSNDTDAGMYVNTPGFLSFAAGGGLVFNVSTTGMRITKAGSASVPSLRINSSDAGFYNPNVGEIGISSGGEHQVTFAAHGTVIEENLTVKGDLLVSGTRFVTSTETVEISDNLLLINNGEVGAGVTVGHAGIDVDRGSLANYRFQFDEIQDNFRVGVSGTGLQAVATREDNPISNKFPYWNNIDYRYDTVSGTLEQEVGGIKVDGVIKTSNGSAGSPAHSFFSDSDTGMYLSSVGTLGFGTGGVRILRVNSTGLRLSVSGTAAYPSLRFNDGDTGFYTKAVNAIGVSAAGGEVAFWNSAGLRLSVSGTAASPVIKINDSNSGLYLSDTNQISLSNNGTETIQFNSSNQTLVDTGSVAVPGLAFIDDTDTGMYLSAADSIGFSTGGSYRVGLNSSGFYFNIGGSAAIPVIRIGDSNTGFYKPSDKTIGVATSGNLRATFADTGLTLQSGATVNEFSTDTTLSGNSDDALPTEKAVKTYVDDKPVSFGFIPHEADDAMTTSSGIVGVCIPQHMDGMNISRIVASVHVPGTTGTTDLQLRRNRAGADVDVLSTKCTIDSAEHSSVTAAASFVVNTSNDDLEEGDIIYLDIDAVQTTPPIGLTVSVSAVLP